MVRPHGRALLPALVWAMLLAALAGGALAALDARFTPAVLAGATLLWLLLATRRVVAWWSTRYLVTTERIIVRSGMIARTGTEVGLTAVEHVWYHQRMIERLLGCGDVVVEPVGEAGPLRLTNVARPRALHSVIAQAHARQASHRGVHLGPPPGPPLGPPPTDEG